MNIRLVLFIHQSWASSRIIFNIDWQRWRGGSQASRKNLTGRSFDFGLYCLFRSHVYPLRQRAEEVWSNSLCTFISRNCFIGILITFAKNISFNPMLAIGKMELKQIFLFSTSLNLCWKISSCFFLVSRRTSRKWMANTTLKQDTKYLWIYWKMRLVLMPWWIKPDDVIYGFLLGPPLGRGPLGFHLVARWANPHMKPVIE